MNCNCCKQCQTDYFGIISCGVGCVGKSAAAPFRRPLLSQHQLVRFNDIQYPQVYHKQQAANLASQVPCCFRRSVVPNVAI